MKIEMYAYFDAIETVYRQERNIQRLNGQSKKKFAKN